MPRLLVVSRSMALAMRIADDHDVVEYPVESLEDLAPAPDVDAVVLDLGEPAAAMQALDRLRARGHDTRVLIVSGYQPAWRDLVTLSLERVVVVPLPITRAALLDGIDRLLGRRPETPPQGEGGDGAPATPAAGSPAGVGPAQPPPSRPLGAAALPLDGPSRRDAPAAPQPSPPPPVPAVPAAAGPSAASGPAAARAPGAPGAEPPGDAGPERAAGDGRRRQGLGRFLSGSGRAPFAVPSGSPLDAGQGGALRGGPAGSPSPGTPPTPAPPEPDLFRPVVEPAMPVRSPSTLPARSPGGARPAPGRGPVTPATGAPVAPLAPARRDVPAAPPVAPVARQSPAAQSAPAPATSPPRPAAPAPAAPAPSAPASAPAPSALTRPGPAEPEDDRWPAAPAGLPRGGGKGRFGRSGRSGADRHPGFTPAGGLEAPASGARTGGEVQEWVRGLLDRRSELFGVNETAQVLADEVIERGEADAAAVLVPDGARWRVSGGVGLRPLERRLLLDTSHWLISEIAVGGRALLIEDTDIVRPRLAGAPLAAWRHLLAVPVPGLRAAVVLARGQEAARFTDRDLAAVVPVVAEAADLLAAALRMRELARAIAPLRDVES